MRRKCIPLLVFMAILSAWTVQHAVAHEVHETTARGVVYHDKNGNGARDDGENGIRDVRVSNGVDIVRTDSNGSYTLPVGDDTILFVLKPRNWATPLKANNVPQFYYLHKPHGAPALQFAGTAPTGPLPESVDFPLTKRKEPNQFKVLMFGDTQVKNQKEIFFLSHDVLEEVIGSDAAFLMSLGDLVHDPLNLFEPLNEAMSVLDMPVYSVIGNHDINYDAADDSASDESYERVYGPSYYSFDYGPVHFIVLDSVFWNGDRYVGRLGVAQLAFFRNDLAEVPHDTPIVLTMHIPLMRLEDRGELFRLLEPFAHTLSFGAHWHTQQHFFLDADEGWQGKTAHHHIVAATACGAWWCGFYNERGIPHTTMADGAPNGYSIVTFDDTAYSIRYKGAGHPASYQLKIMAPNEVTEGAQEPARVLANVFAGSERSTVEMRVGKDGAWTPMQRVFEPDPESQRAREIGVYFEALKEKIPDLPVEVGLRIAEPRECGHMWAGQLPADLPAGTHVIYVRTTDMFGQSDSGKRIIKVNPPRRL